MDNRTKNIKTKILFCIVGLIFTPTLWLKIGPQGYINYGPNVPDVYMFGFAYLGKDPKDWQFISNIQLAIMIFTFLIVLISIFINKRRLDKFITRLSFSLFMLYPAWLIIVTPAIINNSDNAYLTVYPHIGTAIYLLLMYFSFKLLTKVDQTASR